MSQIDLEDQEKIVKKWTDIYTSEVLQYAPTQMQETSEEEIFADIYHSLAHSPLAATMIQLEHTHASAVNRYSRMINNFSSLILFSCFFKIANSVKKKSKLHLVKMIGRR